MQIHNASVPTAYAPGIDLVVVSYRTPDDLDRFLESARDSVLDHETPLHTWVVNVDPLPADLAVTERWRAAHPEISVYEPRENLGYARSCNWGAAQGNSEVIALMNADVTLTETALEECCDALLSDPTWGVLGPRQIDAERRLTAAGIIGTGDAPRHRAWHEYDRGQYCDVVEDCPTVSGAAYFIKRAVWDELCACPIYRASAPTATGAFLPTPHYWDETYCSYHARAHGYKCVYYGPVTIEHRWHVASAVGGWADQQIPVAQAMFRAACDAHGIAHD